MPARKGSWEWRAPTESAAWRLSTSLTKPRAMNTRPVLRAFGTPGQDGLAGIDFAMWKLAEATVLGCLAFLGHCKKPLPCKSSCVALVQACMHDLISHSKSGDRALPRRAGLQMLWAKYRFPPSGGCMRTVVLLERVSITIQRVVH